MYGRDEKRTWTCGNCTFARHTSMSLDGRRVGRCFVAPPKPLRRGEYWEYERPIITEDDWCKEWEPKPRIDPNAHDVSCTSLTEA